MKKGIASIGLFNIKIPENYGGVLRAAHCFDASNVVIDSSRLKSRITNTDTSKAYYHLPVQFGKLKDFIPYQSVPVAVEFIKESIPLNKFAHPKNAFYIFGPEDGSIPSEILEWCKHKVYVPTEICMNLAATVNVVLYDRYQKFEALKVS